MKDRFLTTYYDYELPPHLIAQYPEERRDASRLLALDCRADSIRHLRFPDILSLLDPGDLLVVNDTRVFAARLLGRKETGGKVEMLLLHFPEITSTPNSAQPQTATATVLLRSSRRPRPGSRLFFSENLGCRVDSLLEDGKAKVTLFFNPGADGKLETLLGKTGSIPLPPYIQRPGGVTEEDIHRYQTRYAARTGAVAAPTAGLHFSDRLLREIATLGVRLATITLHVGYGTFAPVRCRDIRDHDIHAEYVEIPERTAQLINQASGGGQRIWAVGTTTVRALESFADDNGRLIPGRGWCNLYIYPGYRFRLIDNLITNFHLPRSSLLFLVSALAGEERIARCYREAIQAGYRFFSYGDAMAIITTPKKSS